MALHLRDLHPDPDQCFDHRGLLHGLSPKNVGPAIARLAAVIARNVPSLRADALRSKSLIYRASSVPTPRTSFGISNICLGPVRKPEHCMATRTARPRLPTPQARGTSPKKKPATRANAAQLSLSGIFLTGYWVLVIRTSRGYRLWDLRGGSTKRRMFFLMAASLAGMAPGVCDPELHSHSSTM